MKSKITNQKRAQPMITGLYERQGFVEIDICRSCVRPIKLGCVQGSILCPILFNVYNSELSSIVSLWEIIANANDAYIIIHGRDSDILAEALEATIIRHENWLESLGMVCNKAKTEVIVFGDKNLTELSAGSDTIKVKKSLKVLGLWLDDEM